MPGRVLDPLGHYALTCNLGGDVVTHHNKLQGTLAETCRRTHLNVMVETGSNLPLTIATLTQHILVPNRSLGKPATFDLSVTLLLNSNVLLEAGLAAGQVARATEERQHEEKDAKCKELGAFAYGSTWVTEAVESFHFWPTLQPSSPDVLFLTISFYLLLVLIIHVISCVEVFLSPLMMSLVFNHLEVVQYKKSLSGRIDNNHLGELLDKASFSDNITMGRQIHHGSSTFL